MTISEEDKKSVLEERKKSFTTKRATVEDLENSLFTIHPVLDHGLVRVIDYMGDDDAIVQAARVSYGAGTKKAQDDNSLLSSIPAGLSIENDLDQQQFDLAVTYFEMNDQENAKKILNQLIKETQNEKIKTASVNLLNKID